jgi:hypothetical protein
MAAIICWAVTGCAHDVPPPSDAPNSIPRAAVRLPSYPVTRSTWPPLEASEFALSRTDNDAEPTPFLPTPTGPSGSGPNTSAPKPTGTSPSGPRLAGPIEMDPQRDSCRTCKANILQEPTPYISRFNARSL